MLSTPADCRAQESGAKTKGMNWNHGSVPRPPGKGKPPKPRMTPQATDPCRPHVLHVSRSGPFDPHSSSLAPGVLNINPNTRPHTSETLEAPSPTRDPAGPPPEELPGDDLPSQSPPRTLPKGSLRTSGPSDPAPLLPPARIAGGGGEPPRNLAGGPERRDLSSRVARSQLVHLFLYSNYNPFSALGFRSEERESKLFRFELYLERPDVPRNVKGVGARTKAVVPEKRGHAKGMAQEMEKLGGTSEEEDEEEMEMEVKEEDDEEEGGSGRGGAALMGMAGTPAGEEMGGRYFEQLGGIGGRGEGMMQGGVIRRPRPKDEKERTKLRERHRRAITARILSGLRRHGNYNLRARADINEVIAALAKEAGWVVLPDGTTFPSRSSASSSPQAPPAASSVAPAQIQPLRGVSPGGGPRSVEYRPLKGVFTPTAASYDGRSRTAVMMGGHRETMVEGLPLAASCTDGVDGKQVTDIPSTQRMPERDFAGTPYVPVYVMLPLGVINIKCELVDPDSLIKQLRLLKSVNVDGVMVDCWWGIVEAHAPQEYNWHGYKKLFQIVRELKLKLQVVMSFHECGGNIGDDVCIPLPHWVAEIGRSNLDIFFTDAEGRRNPECLSWGIDKERVLRGRTALEVYFDYMRSFRVEFDEFFEDDIISEIEVGLGPCGELRYPSYPVKHGWRYPGIGEFLCYDQYLMKSLRKAAEARGHLFWARGPENAGSYNSRPHETGFFCDGGDYDSYYGRFFLNWYSQVLVDHADRVLSLAKLAFEGTSIAAKISGIHWWYKTASHAAELTTGFYNPCNRDGYATIASMLKKHGAALNFTCVELRTLDQHEEFPEALADPEGLVWQVLNAAWDVCIQVASENALPCHDRVGYNKILENSKPMNDPDGRHLSAFTYLRLSPDLVERHNFLEFERFVKRMHGEAVLDLQS